MNVSPRGLRAFRSRPASRRQRSDMVMLAHIKEQSRLSLGSYGRPRMTEELKEIGLNIGHRRVGRLMRQNGISVVRTRKHKATTDSNHKFNIAPNLLDRNFAADGPNQKWAGDITYIWAREGWLSTGRKHGVSPTSCSIISGSGANLGSRSHFFIRLVFMAYRRATCATDTPGAHVCAQIDTFSHPTKNAFSDPSYPS